MMKVDTLSNVVKHRLCVACGACAGLSSKEVTFKEQYGIPIPQLDFLNSDQLFRFCPGKGYDIERIGHSLFGDGTHYDVELGHYRTFCAARSTDVHIAGNASSGGAITAILLHLLDTGRIKGALVAKFIYGRRGPSPTPYIARNKDELLESQGSKYCPVMTLAALSTVREFPGNIAWVGPPCQIAALRMIQAEDNELCEKIPFTITNFCGGFRDFREARRLAELSGVRFEDISSFRYRGDGQPGFMRIETRQGGLHRLPYPDYARRTGYSKMKRCRLCVDATGELADFACGDAWIPRFLSTGIPWSIVLTRSEAATNIVQEMIAANSIAAQDITIDELKKSQRDNLTSKKHRQHARRKLFALLRSATPAYDGGYPRLSGGLFQEMRIHCQYLIFYKLEQMKLYKFVAKLIGRYR